MIGYSLPLSLHQLQVLAGGGDCGIGIGGTRRKSCKIFVLPTRRPRPHRHRAAAARTSAR